ncbi:hypothetical protein ACQUSR_19500 [Streptomyces sp. P1-3]|uniref:hypothetical protein n=1 Tax=Streptomyces sp. P1-3 TaxID=3421658 RepID=UPI003D361577
MSQNAPGPLGHQHPPHPQYAQQPQQPAPYTPYPQQPHPPYAGSHAPYPPFGAPMAMPSQVRTAQVLAFVMAGLLMLACVLNFAGGDPRTAGYVVGAGLPAFGCAICALCFGGAGGGAKVTAIVFGSLMILFGLSAMGQGRPGGLIEVVIGILIVVMLSQRASGEWFRRPRHP